MADDGQKKSKVEDFDLNIATGVLAQVDNRSFAFYERKFTADPSFWPSAEQLVQALKANSKHPIPPDLLMHIKKRLDGTATKKRGRKIDKSPGFMLRKHSILTYYRKYLTWLQKRSKASGLAGWPLIRDAHWWQGPPNERAARMVQVKLGLHIDWRQVLNIYSELNTCKVVQRKKRKIT